MSICWVIFVCTEQNPRFYVHLHILAKFYLGPCCSIFKFERWFSKCCSHLSVIWTPTDSIFHSFSFYGLPKHFIGSLSTSIWFLLVRNPTSLILWVTWLRGTWTHKPLFKFKAADSKVSVARYIASHNRKVEFWICFINLRDLSFGLFFSHIFFCLFFLISHCLVVFL